uniref:Colony stimulating factor 3 receptor n=1 Tax=Neogobius melanostomus TaxID=47308 RepID=A0A8C6UW14_9GOBI
MTSTRLSLIVMLLVSVNGARNENVVQPCAEVQTSSAVVALGSQVSATCTIKEDCPVPIAPDAQIEWRLGEAILPSSSVANQSSRISEVVIPNFNSTMAFLTCRVQTSPPQIVGGVQIRAGYLPSVPHHLHCQTNLTMPSTMSCTWDPGRDSHLPTTYSLHTHIRGSKNYSYVLPPGHHSHTIPRSGFSFYSEMEIYVKAVNELGESNSVPVTLEPLSAAKFEPPEITNIHTLPNKYGCLRMLWKLSLQESWVRDSMNVEVQVTADDKSIPKIPIPVDQCRLQHGTRYRAQMRVRYRQSPWSEWSRSHSGVTLESAPTGRLDSWMKVSGDRAHKQVSVHLFWKPSKQFRANGQNVSYVVSRTRQPGERGQLCATAGRYCTFQAPAKAKVFLSAVNAAGRSKPTEIRIHQNKGFEAITEITVTPYDDTSLLVQWTSGLFDSLLGFVVEWRPLLKTDPSHIQFQTTNKTQTSLIISGGIEPYKPYGISVYPRFKDGIGLPQTADAFSRQKAPSMVPNLRIEKSGYFNVELIWDEIPPEQMNGIIQGYKVYYWKENGTANVTHAKPNERRIFLKNLNPRSVYKAFLMVSTFGGSGNGSTIHFKTESLGHVFSFCRFKGNFCPTIPDPANSSMKEWSTESLEDILPNFSSKEPSLVYLSHLSFLDLPAKVQKEEDDCWLNSVEETSDLGESICGSPTIAGYCGSNSDSVPYATVIFSTSPCTSPVPTENHAYLRSESTQPLLEAEEAFTPMCYQNITAEKTSETHFFGSSNSDDLEEVPEPDIGWDEFPFLSALEMNDSENE